MSRFGDRVLLIFQMGVPFRENQNMIGSGLSERTEVENRC